MGRPRWHLRRFGVGLILVTVLMLAAAVVTNATAVWGVFILLLFVWAIVGLRATSPTMNRFGATGDPGESIDSYELTRRNLRR